MIVKDFLAKIGFKIEGNSELSKSEQLLGGIKSRLDAIISFEAAKKLFELAERFGEFAEQLHIAALNAGIAVEEFQALTFAAKQMGVTQEQLGTSIARLSRNLYEARLGSAQANLAFTNAGLSQEQIASFKNGGDALSALSDRFRQINDPIKKEALAIELFGRGGKQMVAFLSQGSAAMREQEAEARKLGIILKENQVEALVKLFHAMEKVFAVIKAVTASFVAYLAPALEFITNKVLALWSAHKNLFSTKLDAWGYNVGFVIGFAYGLIEDFTKLIWRLLSAMSELFDNSDLSDWAKDLKDTTIPVLQAFAWTLREITEHIKFLNSQDFKNSTLGKLVSLIPSVGSVVSGSINPAQGGFNIGQKLIQGAQKIPGILRGGDTIQKLADIKIEMNVTTNDPVGLANRVKEILPEHLSAAYLGAYLGTSPVVY